MRYSSKWPGSLPPEAHRSAPPEQAPVRTWPAKRSVRSALECEYVVDVVQGPVRHVELRGFHLVGDPGQDRLVETAGIVVPAVLCEIVYEAPVTRS
ncbi:hypothetical protein ACFYVL_28215 [Streptomyces sp. NPDC004111]|uniref:hypothetical protein n=1 Tax=Streptomyces sp. NPDC004111 TaxID=3364690 RepID=UPI00369664EC